MVIKIDVDGVIRNINETMCKLYNDLFDENLTVNDITDYDVEKVFKRIKDEIGMDAVDYFFNWRARDVFLYSNPYENVKEAIEKLRNEGHKVVIVTWQYNLQNKFYTLMFFNNNGIAYDDICFTRDKWMIQGDWLIDDNPEFITDKRDKSKKIIIDMPYNKECKGYKRKNNLKEAIDYIINEENITIWKEIIEERDKRKKEHPF